MHHITILNVLLFAGTCVFAILYRKAKKRATHTPIESPESSTTQSEPIGDKQLDELKRLSIVAQQTDNAIMLMDPDGNIQWINDGFTRLYEFTFDQFISMRGSNILQTSFNPRVKERLDRCKSTKQPVYYEAINVTPSGKRIWTHTSLTPILDENEQLIHLVTVDSDITKRKNASDALVENVHGITEKISLQKREQDKLLADITLLLQHLEQATEKMRSTDKIVRYINDVADRIRIMGLNASIESSRAGAVGNGFRVISNEIVLMSDESKRYAKEINDIVVSLNDEFAILASGKNRVSEASISYQATVDALRHEVSKVSTVIEKLN